MKFYKSEETLNTILNIINNKERGAYLRFGDGDINLSLNQNDLLQKSNDKLSFEMREALMINHKNVLKTLPLYCKKYNGLEPHMFPGNHEAPDEWCDNILDKAKPNWGEFDDIYSHVALHYLASYNMDISVNFLRNIKDKVKVFIGNENVPIDILKLICADDFVFIKTPPNNSYNAIDNIEIEYDKICDNFKDYHVVITSMGCSGRVMQKRIYNKNKNNFLFDFGSLLDALCGWDTRAWIKLSKFNSDLFFEKLKQ